MTTSANNTRLMLYEEEREILLAFEAGQLVSNSVSSAQIALHTQYAAHSLRKNARINIRLSSKDLKGIQSRAFAEGIPYQTLAASVLHKFVEGRLVEAT